MESNQFLINYISDDAWAGLSLKHGGSISQTRDNIGYARELINGKTWKGTNGTISITATSQYSGSNYNGKLNNIVWCLEGWESDSGFPECKDPASFYKEGEYQGIARTWYRVKVERCINVSSASFESSSSMLLQATIDDDYFYCDGGYGYKIHLSRENIFKGEMRLDDIYSSSAKLIIDGMMNDNSFKREYSLN